MRPHRRRPRPLRHPVTTRHLALGLCALGALGGLGACTTDGLSRDHEAPALDIDPRGPLERILALEDARRDDAGELRELLRDASPRLRARAALALARFEAEDLGRPATDALVQALGDSDPRVRENAAFGLGLRGDTTASLALVAHLGDTDPEVRAALVEAATRLVDRTLVPHVLRALGDPDARVRLAAADGVQRWPWFDRAGAADGDRALARELDTRVAERALAPLVRAGVPLAGFADAAPGGPREPEELEVAWRALAALARRSAPSALPAFQRFAAPVTAPTAGDPYELRVFAAQGLARLAALDDVTAATRATLAAALEGLTADHDTRVVVEAVRGLGACAAKGASSGSTVTALGVALAHPSTHVRIVAWEALGSFADAAPVSHLLARFEDEDAPPAVAAALVALAKLRAGRASGDVERAAESPDLVVRKGAASAAGELPSDRAVPLLLTLAQDPHPKVAAEAVTALARHAGDEPRRALRAALEHRDSGVRLAAALALRDLATAEDVPSLQLTALSSAGDAGPEARFEAARTLARVPDEGARRTLARLAREDTDPYVRRVARGLLAELGRDTELLAEDAAREAQREADTRAGKVVPPPDVPTTVAVWRGPNPRVTFVTNRGELTFELLPREAPHHVTNLLELVRRGAYDATSWHRVVPDFVVQGGDPRGDGNGGGTWRGPDDALRLEVTRRRYRTGSLGMPRNEDRDSGGRQVFVTHRPTPHLDGRYTIFGELQAGFDVLAALQEGDTIVTARVE